MVRTLLWFGLFLAASYLLVLVVIVVSQQWMVFVPTRQLVLTPDQLGLRYESHFIAVEDGERIHAWYLPGDSSRPTILYCHENAGNISRHVATSHMFVALGFNVLAFDYRGYGESDGSPSERNVYADATAAYRWLTDARGVFGKRIIVFGRSLGGAVAIELAAREPVGGLIVESSFTNAREMGKKLLPFLPLGSLLRYRFASDEKIGQVRCPVLIVHSPEDDLIPYAMGRRLFALAKEPKQFHDIFGEHNDRGYLADAAYLGMLRAFGDTVWNTTISEGDQSRRQSD